MLGQDSNFAPIPFTCPIKKLLWNSAHQDIKTWKLKQGEEKKKSTIINLVLYIFSWCLLGKGSI